MSGNTDLKWFCLDWFSLLLIKKENSPFYMEYWLCKWYMMHSKLSCIFLCVILTPCQYNRPLQLTYLIQQEFIDNQVSLSALKHQLKNVFRYKAWAFYSPHAPAMFIETNLFLKNGGGGGTYSSLVCIVLSCIISNTVPMEHNTLQSWQYGSSIVTIAEHQKWYVQIEQSQILIIKYNKRILKLAWTFEAKLLLLQHVTCKEISFTYYKILYKINTG